MHAEGEWLVGGGEGPVAGRGCVSVVTEGGCERDHYVRGNMTSQVQYGFALLWLSQHCVV